MRLQEIDYIDTSYEGLRPFIFGQKKPEDAPEALDEAVNKLKTELQFWEKYIQPSGFLVGDQLTAADVGLYPTLAFLGRFGVTLKDFPNLKKFRDEMAKRESVQKTVPPHWKDTPPAFQLKDKI